MPREIGWSIEANLLYQIKQLLKRLQGSVSSIAASDDVSFPVLTTNGKYIPLITATPVFPSTYLSTVWTVGAIGKTYPDTSVVYKASSTLPIPTTSETAATQFTISGIELTTLSTTYTIAASNFTTGTYSDLKYSVGAITFAVSAASFTTLNFPELIFANGITINSTNTVLLNMPKLETLLSYTNQRIGYSVPSFPELLYVNTFNDSSVTTSNTSYSFPKLKVANTFTIGTTKSSLTTISFPSIEYINSLTLPTTSASLTTFTFGSSLRYLGSNFVTTSNSLNQASVDNILIRLAALDGTGDTVAYSSKTVTITGGAATPSAAGLAAKAVLVARGCTVTNN